ncbi:hypothetical protein N6B72_05010 [Chryseobacterium soli]|uniref:hypothetical protein n=1 Tax=Chryseobacterium soli TaxID=445961 RepID=UPI002953A99D|nr:hypothetical protein [Chryseobacterium soli]MDV7696276.1 hypothetical protein [Chryseobacterium soli]
MANTDSKLGVVMSISVILLLILIFFKNDIDFLSKENNIYTSAGIGNGVFFSIGDFLTYNIFVISAVLTILWISSKVFIRK